MADQFVSYLLSKQRFFITTHARPDGDAIGSQLGMGIFLQKLGKDVFMMNSDHVPENMTWLEHVDLIQTYDKSITQRERVDAADAILILDANSMDRLGDVGTLIKNSNSPKLLIDHHTNPESWFDQTYSRESASSTAELVYEIIASYDLDLIDSAIATALYAGIVTDTGSFRYSAVVPELHRITAELLERGNIKPAPIHTAIYDTRSLSSLRLLSRALATVTLKYDGVLGYMIISQKLLRDLHADSEETEGFVNYALSISTVQVALLFLETAKGTKVSFRSKSNMPVNEWARSLGGGGHKNASGAFVKKSLERTISDVVQSAPQFLALGKSTTAGEEPDSDTLSEEDASYLSSLLDIKDE